MKLLVFNGSPRRDESNTEVMCNYLINGFSLNKNIIYEYHYLKDIDAHPRLLQKIDDFDTFLIAFPLYFLSMPACVKHFIELLPVNKTSSQKIGFLVQSGFPEINQCEPVEQYLKHLSQKLNYIYLGTIIKGFGNCLQINNLESNEPWLRSIKQLGQTLGEKGYLDHKIINDLIEPYKLSPVAMVIQKILTKTGILDSYTKNRLKQNKVSEKDSYARPLLDDNE